jgi:hypothetical protein
MRLIDKLRQVVKTAVADLFSEETETAAPDPTAALLQETQRHLDKLRSELARPSPAKNGLKQPGVWPQLMGSPMLVSYRHGTKVMPRPLPAYRQILSGYSNVYGLWADDMARWMNERKV